jgi:hypothetical protein
MKEKIESLEEIFDATNMPLIYDQMTRRNKKNSINFNIIKINSEDSLYSVGTFYKHISKSISKSRE